MKLNTKTLYFLRGLGVGMILTAFIFVFIPRRMSNAEIISAAKGLGMIEATTSSNLQNIIDNKTSKEDAPVKQTATTQPTVAITPIIEPTVAITPTIEPTKAPTVAPTKEPTPVPTVAPTVPPKATVRPLVTKTVVNNLATKAPTPVPTKRKYTRRRRTTKR